MRGLLVLWCLLASTSLVCGANEPSLPTIWKAQQVRKNQLHNVWVKYRVSEFLAKEFFEITRKAYTRPGTSGGDETYSDLRYEVTAELIRKGHLHRVSYQGPWVVAGKLKPSQRPVLAVYNGKRALRVGELDDAGKRFLMSSRPEQANGYAHPWDLCGEDVARAVIEGDVSGQRKALRSTITQDVKPGVLLLEIEFENHYLTKLWLLSELGYCVSKVEAFDPAGALQYRIHDVDYQTVDGVPYPIRATRSSYLKRGTSTSLFTESRLEVTSITLSGRDIPDSLFEVAIPPDAELYDADQGKYVRNPDRVQTLLDEIARESPRMRRNRLTVWIVGGGALLCASLGAGWWFWRARHRRTSSP